MNRYLYVLVIKYCSVEVVSFSRTGLDLCVSTRDSWHLTPDTPGLLFVVVVL